MRYAARKDGIERFDLSTVNGRCSARKAGFDVPKMNPGPKPVDVDAHIEKTDSCWNWTGRVNRWGYGFYCLNHKTTFAHRTMWERANNKSAKGFVVMHMCDNPRCVNPAHLSIGTHRDNQLDKVRKNRHAKGEQQGTSKLTEAQVIEIRAKWVPRIYTKQMLADEYGVCKDTIHKAVSRKYWRHI